MPRYAAVVADASPLISLEKLPDGFGLLRQTCARLIVPQAVAEETSFFLREGDDYFEHHGIRKLVEVEVVPSRAISIHHMAGADQLGPGERYAIALAKARQVPLMVEERKARRLAQEGGLQIFGAAAIIKIAREEGGINFNRASELLQALFRANRINRKILDRMLEALR